MKHITEEYGQPCDIIESTVEEFYIFKNFLKLHGIEARMIMSCGDTCTWQIRNGYKDWVYLNKNEKVCERIINIVEENIENNVYSR